MTLIARRTLLALAATGTLVLAGCGDDDKTSGSTTGNGIDRAFVAEMVPHHEAALDMAKIAAQRAEGTFVKQLAGNISASQAKEIATMRSQDAELADAGVETGSLGVPEHMMGMDGAVSTLRTAKPFDAAFLKLMIPHHEGAIPMSKAEIAGGSDPELKALARQIIDVQRREIAQMRAHLAAGEAGDAMHGEGHSG